MLFTLGIFGILSNQKNVLIVLMSIELISLSVSLNLIIFSIYLDNNIG